MARYRSFLIILLIFPASQLCAQGEPDVVPPKERGLYAIWYAQKKYVLDFPYIKGGQVVVDWADVEPQKGVYDFSLVDEKLGEMKALNKTSTLQINGTRKPAWLFKEVPYYPGKLSAQVLDTMGSLMYWHPSFVKAYLDFIKAYAFYLKNSEYSKTIVGIRMNFNALGTEHLEVPQDKRALDKWIVPPGVKQGLPWTREIAARYRELITDKFVSECSDVVNVFLRNNISDEIIEKNITRLETGKLMLFHTSSEMEPRSAQMEHQYYVFKRFGGSGKTLAYAESWADSWGLHGGIQDERWTNPARWNYWRLLSDLNAGVSLIAVPGTDLQVAIGKEALPKKNGAEKYKNEFYKAYLFAGYYAGYHASPSASPGAWIAFRHNEKNRYYGKLEKFTGNYEFLVKQVGPDECIWENVINVGPESQRFGAWAKILPGGKRMELAVSDMFIAAIKDKPAVLRVVYFDKGKGSFEMLYSGRKTTVNLTGTDVWKTAEFPLSRAAFEKNASGAHITITAASGDICFHMAGIEHGNGLPKDVLDVTSNLTAKGLSLTWKNPAVYDIDSIAVYNENKLVKSVACAEEEMLIENINTLSVNKLTIKTIDEAGRKSAGILLK